MLRERSIGLLEPLAEDLAEWRAACGSPDRGWVFPHLRKRKWLEWVHGDYRRAARPAGRGRAQPFALRHTFCALLIGQGAGLDDVARQMALSRHETIAQYAHLFEEASVEHQQPVSASVRIREARGVIGRKGRLDLRRFLGRPLAIVPADDPGPAKLE
jgi:integrase